MGLTIHYKGNFRDPALLPEMISQIKDISREFKWDYHIYETKFASDGFGREDYNGNIYGISTSPPNCEALWFGFLSNGMLSSPLHLQFWGKTDKQPKDELLYQLFTKTQFGCIEVHKIVVHLFRRISEKYLKDITMMDEGGYCESRDEKVLEKKLNGAIT